MRKYQTPEIEIMVIESAEKLCYSSMESGVGDTIIFGSSSTGLEL